MCVSTGLLSCRPGKGSRHGWRLRGQRTSQATHAAPAASPPPSAPAKSLRSLWFTLRWCAVRVGSQCCQGITPRGPPAMRLAGRAANKCDLQTARRAARAHAPLKQTTYAASSARLLAPRGSFVCTAAVKNGARGGWQLDRTAAGSVDMLPPRMAVWHQKQRENGAAPGAARATAS